MTWHPDYARVVAQMSARQASAGMKLGLDRVRALLDALGRPDHAFRSILVAGTNGKGSTCAFAASLLRAAGLRTGLYTSPHLCRFTERITVDGREIPTADVVALHDEVLAASSRVGVEPTFFELATAIGFLHLARSGVDVAVLEVGLGGRLDATNAARVDVCGIAPVDLDHMAILGNTVALIAAEKAGILRPGVPAVVAHQSPDADAVIRRVAAQVGAPAVFLGPQDTAEGTLGLLGPHQPANARLALELVRALGVSLSAEQEARGLRDAFWPGRMEWLWDAPGGPVLLDGAHNAHGARALAAALNADPRLAGAARVVLVTAATGDRDPGVLVAGLWAALARAPVGVVATQPRVATAIPAQRVAELLRAQAVPTLAACGTMEEALAVAAREAGEGGVRVVMGSLYAVGLARALLTGEPLDPLPLSG